MDNVNESTYAEEVLCAGWNPTVEAIAEYIQENRSSDADSPAEAVDEIAFLNRIYIYQE